MKILLASAAVLSLFPYTTALSGGTHTSNGNVQLQKRNMEERAIVAGHHDSSLNQHEHFKRQRTNRKKECTDSASCRSKYFRPEDFVTTSTTQPATTNPSQTAIPGPITTTPAPAPTENPGAPVTTPSNCQCGYSISKLNNAYMSGYFNIDFRDTHSVEDLVAAGFVVNNGWQSGAAAADGTVAYGDVANLRFAADGLHFVVPGGQKRGGVVTAAEIQFGNGFTKVYTEAEIQVDATPGTCQALFTFAAGYPVYNDEQDIEVIAASLLDRSAVADAGIQLTNHSPSQDGVNSHRIVPFPSDPTTGMHTYSIAWDRTTVKYGYDGQTLPSPSGHVSQNPSNVILNHWATGDEAFFGAPLPQIDVVMKVRSLKIYYESNFDSAMPAGCTQSDVCVV